MANLTPCFACKKESDPEKNIFCPHCSGKLKIDKYVSMEQDYNNFSRLGERLDDNKNGKKQNIRLEKSVIWASLGSITWWITIQIFLYGNYITTKPGRTSILNEIFQSKSNDQSGFQKRMTEIAENFRLIPQNTFYTQFLFQVESFLRSIDEQIPNKKQNRIMDFNEMQKRVLKHVDISDYEKKIDIIKTMSLIRNCLHNDGYYSGKDNEHTKIGKYHFDFIIDERTPYRSWKHLHFFAEKIIDVLEEISVLINTKNIPISNRLPRYDN